MNSSKTDTTAQDAGEKKPLSRRHGQYSKRTDRKGRALTLAQEIKALQARPEFSDFRGDLEQAIRRVRFTGGRSAKTDRELVLASLEEHERMGIGAPIADIINDTTLTKPEVKAVLDELVMKDIVEMYERPDEKRGPKVMLYKLLRGSRADVANSPAFARMPRSEDFPARRRA